MYSEIDMHVHPPAGTVILRRPEKRNAITRRMLGELEQALFDLNMEKKVRTVILTGAGSAFCAGMDLEEMRATAESDYAQAQWGRDAELYRDLLLSLLRFPKPVIAAVNGPVVAGGAGLMLAADIVLAGRSGRFGLPEPRRGIVAGMVSPLLVYRIGAGYAARLLLGADLVDAEEAHRMGLYHELVEEDKLWARAMQLAGECARGAPEALQLTKRMLNENIGEHLVTLLSAGAAVSATARTTEAAGEGLQAFLEKREPEWP